MAIPSKDTGLISRKTADDLLYRSLRAAYHFERSLVERFGLGYQEIYLLQLLRRRESARVGDIAAALGIKIFTTTRLVQRLEILGYVSRERDEKDRRVVWVKLEPKGDLCVDAIETGNFRLIVNSTSRLSTPVQRAFLLAAQNLDRALGVEDRVDTDP